MKRNKTLINFVTSLSSQIVILVMGLIIPRIILINYGSDTNGFTGTISQIFTYMALLEAGISQATRNALYKPVINNDNEKISYYMSTSRKYYRRISIFYFSLVCVIAIAMPFVLKTNVNFGTIFFYIFFEGLTNVVSFYFINTWTSFLWVSGKTYIINTINMIQKVLCYSIKILLAMYGINVALIQIGYFVVSLVQLCFYYTYMRKKYSWIDYNKADESAKLPNRNSFIITEIAWIIFSATDMIVLSIFVSTSMASVYSVYNMVFIALNGLLNSVYNGLNYNLGQQYAKDKNKYYLIHDAFHMFFVSTMTVMMCVTYILIIPFVKIYTNGVTDINYVYSGLPALFCIVQILSWSRNVPGNLTGIAGFAKQFSMVSLIEAIINVVLSLVLVNFLGIFGVLIATVFALPIKVIYCNWLSEKKIMKRTSKNTIKMLGLNYTIFGATILVCLFININITSYSGFIIYGCILLLIYSCVVYCANYIINKDNFLTLKELFFKCS